jgi:mannose-6-phosphate isomerase-like protein (cupin superfamily)
MARMPVVVNLAEKFGRFAEHWTPKVVGELNGQQVKVVKLLGEFVWHHHAEEDELILVVRGRLQIQFRGGEVSVGAGERPERT